MRAEFAFIVLGLSFGASVSGCARSASSAAPPAAVAPSADEPAPEAIASAETAFQELEQRLLAEGTRLRFHITAEGAVEVDLRGEPQAGCLALPIEAVHGTTVYVVDAEDRVELRSVELSWAQEEFVCVGEGLVAGERVVTSSLTPAVAGMLLEPTVDEFEAQRLETLVDGEQPEP